MEQVPRQLNKRPPPLRRKDKKKEALRKTTREGGIEKKRNKVGLFSISTITPERNCSSSSSGNTSRSFHNSQTNVGGTPVEAERSQEKARGTFPR